MNHPSVMEIEVLYFAHVRQITGKNSESLMVKAGATAGDVVDSLCTRYPGLRDLMPAIRIAVDGEFAPFETQIHAGAELVLIPPVAGGMGVAPVELTTASLDQARLESLTALVSGPEHGAIVTFTGIVRNHARGKTVTRLYYEAYEPMALKQLQTIVAMVEEQFPATRVVVHHRLGMLEIGEAAVMVVAASAHRREAFDACQTLMDQLKADVPIWKREYGAGDDYWVTDRP
jgi:molybdopterin converting factor subunit 1